MASLKLSDTILLGCLLPSSFLYKNIYMYTYNFFFHSHPNTLVFSIHFIFLFALLYYCNPHYFILFFFFSLYPTFQQPYANRRQSFAMTFANLIRLFWLFFFSFLHFFFIHFLPFNSHTLEHVRVSDYKTTSS